MPSPECHDEDHQGVLPKDIAERQRGFRNVVQQGLILLIVIACVVVWAGVLAPQEQTLNSAVPQSIQSVHDPTDDDWSAGDAATDDDDWVGRNGDVECLSDHLESFHLITPGQGLCAGRQYFGMTRDDSLILHSNGETHVLHQNLQAYAFQMTDQGYFQFLDIDNRVLWEAIPKIAITPMPVCRQSLSQDCPHLQLQENGDLVLSSVNTTGSLLDAKVHDLFPYLFQSVLGFPNFAPRIYCVLEMMHHWLYLSTGQGICSDEQRFGVTDDGALVVHSNGVTTVLYQNKLATLFQFTKQGHFLLRDGNNNIIWEASPTVELGLDQPTKDSLFPMLRFDQNGMFVATTVTNNSTFTSYNISDIFPDLFL